MTDTRISRRRLIGAGAAAGAGVALGGGAGAATAKARVRRRSRHADVVVVGAGFAGLTAARRIVHAGHSAIVLEARNRVGGRVLNHRLPGGDVSERGGTFVGPTQDHLMALAKEMGVGTFPTYDTGDNVYISGGKRSTYSDTGVTGTAPLDPVILPDLTLIVTALDAMSTHVPVDAPWDAAKASQWDSQTLESWIDSHSITPQFRELTRAATRPIFGAEPRELSLLYVLFYIASSGNERNPGTFERNFDTRGGAQESRFIGGSQSILIKIARELGRRVVLESPVRSIVQEHGGVRVESDRMTVRAKRVIVAMPPTLTGRIYYSPSLPFGRDQLTQRMPQGTLTKATAVYDRPFWRDKGLNGTAVSTGGPVSATFDDSPPGGKPGVVFGFIGGDRARQHAQRSPAQKRAAVLANFVEFFGAEGAHPIDYFETSWSANEWTRGCPVAIPGPGVLTAYGHHLRTPIGRIHWAGTETSNYWNGYMDGAVRSGERAAREVLDEL